MGQQIQTHGYYPKPYTYYATIPRVLFMFRSINLMDECFSESWWSPLLIKKDESLFVDRWIGGWMDWEKRRFEKDERKDDRILMIGIGNADTLRRTCLSERTTPSQAYFE